MSQIVADLLLLLVTIVWGTTFVIVKNAIRSVGPLTFVGIRFSIGGFVLLAWYIFRQRRSTRWMENSQYSRDYGKGSRGELQDRLEHDQDSRRLRSLSGHPVQEGQAISRALPRRLIAGSLVTGLALTFAYVTQTFGLVTVAAGKAAFITGLSVVMVPLASSLILRAKPDRDSIFGVILATIGLGLMSLEPPLGIAPGDLLVLLCAVGFAAHIILVGTFSPGVDPVLFAAIQLFTVSLGSLIFALMTERPLKVPGEAWGAIFFTALAATAFAFLIQSAVQRYTSATHTALIFSAEPVFGAVFAWLLAGEALSGREIAGGLAIVLGMLVSETGSLRATSRKTRFQKTTSGEKSPPEP